MIANTIDCSIGASKRKTNRTLLDFTLCVSVFLVSSDHLFNSLYGLFLVLHLEFWALHNIIIGGPIAPGPVHGSRLPLYDITIKIAIARKNIGSQ